MKALLLVSVLFLLFACGGGGSGPSDTTSSGNAPTPQPSQTNLFPLSTDLRWKYSNSSQFVEIAPNQNIAGNSVTPMIFPSGGKEYYRVNGNNVNYYGYFSLNVSIAGVSGSFSTDVQLAEGHNVLIGEGNSIDYTGKGTVEITPTYGTRDIDYTLSVTNLGKVEVTVPYGTFLATHIELAFIGRVVIDGVTISAVVNNQLWFAENIGIVRRVENDIPLNLVDYQGTDSDNDGLLDRLDEFPNNSNEQYDTDNDGTGNNEDADDDNDGYLDDVDAFPLDPSEHSDLDSDGVGDNKDEDIDGDTVKNIDDAFPLYPSEWLDSDGDGIGNNEDEDDDNDGTPDIDDHFPLDPTLVSDLDGDGIDDSIDPDIDGDGVDNNDDAFPRDPNESVDTDFDGIGNNSDEDDDGDYLKDAYDHQPLLKNRPVKMVSNVFAISVLYDNGALVSWRHRDGRAAYTCEGDSGNYNEEYIESPDLHSDVVDVYSSGSAMMAQQSDGTLFFWGFTGSGGGQAPMSIDSQIEDVKTTFRSFAILLDNGDVITVGCENYGGNSSNIDFDDGVTSLQAIEVSHHNYLGGAFLAYKNNGEVVYWGNNEMVHRLNTLPIESGSQVYSTNSGSLFAVLSENSRLVSEAELTAGFNGILYHNNEFRFSGVEIEDVASVYTNKHAFAVISKSQNVDVFGSVNFGANLLEGQLIDVKSIVPSTFSFSAIKTDGSAYVWGFHSVPDFSIVQAFDNVEQIFPYYSDSFIALKQDGSLHSWGSDIDFEGYLYPDGFSEFINLYGSVGILDNNRDLIFIPCASCSDDDLPVRALLKGIVQLEMLRGTRGNIAIREDGAVIGWEWLTTSEVFQSAYHSRYVMPEN